ncbi:acyl carrier protein [Patescibacteria group bacterium]|nr:acyl carrier protein [Patescibacteria group bacterium]
MTFNDLVAQFLKIPLADIRDELTPKDIPDWDSMNYLLFIAELEKEYNISFTMDEVLSAQSIGDVRARLLSKGITL